jgi:formate/nitrite transporter FocA (FNT family)
VDSTVLALFVLGIFALPFIKQRWSLIASYVVGGLFAGYGIITIVLSFVEQNHLSGLVQIIGAITFAIGVGMVVLARLLYRRKNQPR